MRMAVDSAAGGAVVSGFEERPIADSRRLEYAVDDPGAPTGLTPALVGGPDGITRLRPRIDAVGSRSCTVLICGESGTGKELVARHIHAASPRAAGPFVALDCTTLRDTLLESQLFGHVKGAFTGAEHATLGAFRAAEGGTLFLDEIGELAPPLQSKLLRCLQERAVVPVGAVKPVPVDVRFLAATNRDLPRMVRDGQFREDLYYRLNVVCLELPPLRARRADILPLAAYFLRCQAETYDEPVKKLAPCARRALAHYSWPGNVRELRNAIEHACVFCKANELTACDLPSVLRAHAAQSPSHAHRRVIPLARAERILIRRALRATGGNQTAAAQLLGIERHRLARMLRRHGLTR